MNNQNILTGAAACLISIFYLSCCGAPNMIEASQAKKITSKLHIGDSQEKVLSQIEPYQTRYRSHAEERDYKHDETLFIDGKKYKVKYIKTHHVADNRFTEDEFTPLIFENNKLVGIGKESENQLKLQLVDQLTRKLKFDKPAVGTVKAQIMNHVFNAFKDPDSALIRNISIGDYGWSHLGPAGFVYGYEIKFLMNIKNGFGGYTGYESYNYIFTKSGLTIPITNHSTR